MTSNFVTEILFQLFFYNKIVKFGSNFKTHLFKVLSIFDR